MQPSLTVRVPRMFRQTYEVFRRPSVKTFEQFEQGGTFVDAVTYVTLIAAVVSLLSMFDDGDRVWKASTLTAAGMWLSGTAVTVLPFVVFVLVLFYLGRRYGGTGSLNEVSYTFALFLVPLNVLIAAAGSITAAVPVVGEALQGLVLFLALPVTLLYAYLALKSSLNQQEPARMTNLVGSLLAAYFASEVTQWLLRGLLL